MLVFCKEWKRKMADKFAINYNQSGLHAQKNKNPVVWDCTPSSLGTSKIQKIGIQQKSQKQKLSKPKSMSPKMSARSGLAGKRTCRPHLGPSQVICSMDKKTI